MHSQSRSTNADVSTLTLFAVASAATIALGSLGIALHGVPLGNWVRNPAAYGAGLILGGALIAAGRTRGLSAGWVMLTIGGLAATLFAPDESGIHRWIDLGPLHINVAALLLPMAIVALAGMAAPILLTAIATIGLLLVAQPDASQASAFGIAAALLLWQRRDLSPAMRLGGMLGLAALVTAAWLRPDPLQPLPEVEGVFALLADVSLPLALAAAAALAATSLLPLRRLPSPDSPTASGAWPLVGYFITAALMPLAGAYPVPLVGIGMSAPLGYWLGVALLCARMPRTKG